MSSKLVSLLLGLTLSLVTAHSARALTTGDFKNAQAGIEKMQVQDGALHLFGAQGEWILQNWPTNVTLPVCKPCQGQMRQNVHPDGPSASLSLEQNGDLRLFVGVELSWRQLRLPQVQLAALKSHPHHQSGISLITSKGAIPLEEGEMVEFQVQGKKFQILLISRQQQPRRLSHESDRDRLSLILIQKP